MTEGSTRHDRQPCPPAVTMTSAPVRLAVLLAVASGMTGCSTAAAAAAAASAFLPPAGAAEDYIGDAQTVALRGGSEPADCGGGGGATITTLPLLPHRTLLERRRRERRLAGLPDDDDGGGDLNKESPHSRRASRRGAAAAPAAGRSLDDLRYSPGHQQVGALYQGYGTHYVDLWVGTPPQRQTVIVDTGSGITAFPCSGCKDCGESYHTDGYFVEADSSTFETLGCSECFRGRCSSAGGGSKKKEKVCKISMSYQEGSSWSAYEGRDVAYAGGRHDRGVFDEDGAGGEEVDGADPNEAAKFGFKLTFGCQISLTGLFKTQLADGIMGMDNAGASFWAQMHSQKAIPERKFSLCFNRQNLASREGTMAGALTLGGEDNRLHTSPMVLSKNVRSSGFYTVRLKKMYLREGGGVSARYDPTKKVHRLDLEESVLNSGGVIVDSGTTDTYMSRKIGSAFKAIWRDVVGKPYSHDPVKLTDDQLAKLPTVLFQIQADESSKSTFPNPDEVVGLAGKSLDPDSPDDIVIAMPASHYMEYDSAEDRYVARLYLEEGSGSVLGANLMMGHDVTFDVDAKTIGWAESDCDYGHLVDGGSMGDMDTKSGGPGAADADGAGKCGAGCIVGVVFGVLGGCVACCLAFFCWKRRRDEKESEVQVVAMNEEDYEAEAMQEGYDDQDIGVEVGEDPNFEGHEIVVSESGDGTRYVEDMNTLGDGTFGQEGKSLYQRAPERDDHDYDDDRGDDEYEDDRHGEYHDDPTRGSGYHDDPDADYHDDRGGSGVDYHDDDRHDDYDDDDDYHDDDAHGYDDRHHRDADTRRDYDDGHGDYHDDGRNSGTRDYDDDYPVDEHDRTRPID